MRTYPVDIDPEQIVRWLRTELEVAPSSLKISTTRATDDRKIPLLSETHLSDEDREDVDEVATIATLEIAPVHASEGWRLTVLVEDEVGPRIPDEGMLVEGKQTVDLVAFDREFIQQERGNACVTAEMEGAESETHLARLIEAIQGDHHPASEKRDPAARHSRGSVRRRLRTGSPGKSGFR